MTWLFKWFLAKRTGLWYADLSCLPIRGRFFGQKPLKLMSWHRSQKSLTLEISKCPSYIGLLFLRFLELCSQMKWIDQTSFMNSHKFGAQNEHFCKALHRVRDKLMQNSTYILLLLLRFFIPDFRVFRIQTLTVVYFKAPKELKLQELLLLLV